jgi:outer membrane lipoprotein-sorting protein
MRALLVAAALLLPSIAVAQPSAPTVLAGIDSAYSKVKAAKLEFEQTTKDAVFGTDAKTGGWIYLQRPNRVRWTYLAKDKNKKAPTKEFIAKGGKMVYVDHKNKQYTKPVSAKTSSVPAALSWLTGKGRLAKEFSPVITATTTSTIELELTPLKPSAAYSKIKLVVDAKTYQVQESVVTASNGNSSGYVFKNVNLDAKLDDKSFEFRPNSKDNKDYREVDLDKAGAPP